MTPRIAMLSVHTSPLAALGGKETGGMNVYVRELARQLGERGWEVDVYTRAQKGPAPRVERLDEPGWRTIYLPAGPLEAVDRRALFPHLPAFVAALRDYAAGEGLRYDLIHSHYWLSGWVALELAPVWRVPVVHMFHTLGKMKDLVADGPEQREAANRAEVEAEVMRRVDRVVAATPLDLQHMVDGYGANAERITVIPCGVNRQVFFPIPQSQARRELGIPDERRLLLFVGRLDPVKGLDVLLRAMCELTRRLRPCQARNLSLAVIGGDRESHLELLGDDPDCLHRIRRELGLEDLVVFVGSRAQESLPLYYSAAEVCVMPSLYESFGMVALEAMACGTPVIASRVGGLTYTVRDGETGYLVPERDPEALAQRLEWLLRDEELRRRLSRRALEVAAEYGWEVVTEAIEALYAELGVSLSAEESRRRRAQPCLSSQCKAGA